MRRRVEAVAPEDSLLSSRFRSPDRGREQALHPLAHRLLPPPQQLPQFSIDPAQ